MIVALVVVNLHDLNVVVDLESNWHSCRNPKMIEVFVVA